MKKILYIHHAIGWGGAPKSMIELIKSLDRMEYSPFVLLLKNSVVAEQLKKNDIPYAVVDSLFYRRFYSYIIHSEAGYIKWYQFYKLTKQLILWFLSKYIFARRVLDQFEFDIVHINTSVLTDWLKPCNRKAKTIIHIREPFRKGHLDLLYWLLRDQMKKYADKIIAISEDNARRVNLPGKTNVIYNYADLIDFEPSEESYRSKMFLYLGGAQQIKGFYTLVDALSYLNEDVRILFGGNYSVNETFKGKVKVFIGWGKQHRQSIVAMRNHPRAQEIGMVEDVSKYIDESCCIISAFSKPHFSRSAIEAHLRKKAVIGSDVEGMREVVEDEVNGVIIPADNAQELAKNINQMSGKPAELQKMGENGYDVAKSKFTNKNIQLFEKVYKDICVEGLG